ncbi:MAG TPA: penicillin-binding protein 2 [Treponemataceae bacterium]|nr:penicillin-binding protein 2 [Treponemataceae bacterium]
MRFQLTDIKKDNGNSKKDKIYSMMIFVAVIFGIYVLKLFSMQVIEGSSYRKQSQNLSQRSKQIPAQRGEIYDRNVQLPLVVNTDSFAVDIIPGDIGADMYDTVALKLASFLGIQKSDIDKKVPPNVRRSYTSIEIKSGVTFNIISNIAENLSDLPGVSWRSKPLRSYVQTGSMSHIIGYVGDVTREELKILYNKGYTNNSIIGKTGIEKQYDELLQGIPGSESRVVDVKERLVTNNSLVVKPVMGKNLVLTIDSDIQILAEKALGNRIGAAVVLKPASGEILAMVSYPFFDANLFSRDDSSAVYNALANDKSKPLLNRAVNAAYSPASTFKVLMTAAVLSEQSFGIDQKIECSGSIHYGDRAFNCHIGKPGHGYLDLKNALAQSCNIYFWTVGRDHLGVDRISSYAQEFGYGQSAEIDLPSQSAGFVPTAQWKERRYHEKWLGGDTMNLSIGQGYLQATPLQVANMMAMVVNNGTIYKPHLLKEVIDPVTGDVVDRVGEEVLFQSNIDQEYWQIVKEYLRYTVTDGSASSVLMRNKVVEIAGKTGTAEVAGIRNSWHSWFVAYAPFNAPPEDAVVVAVLVEAENQWEWWGPYASTIIFQGIFANQTFDEAVNALGFRYLTKPVGRQE